ncbi:hypothetical protein GR254_25040, partial [Mycobacterium tuberculosis]|nr:hypothetical protein [Mycobacterium tuberculosis]
GAVRVGPDSDTSEIFVGHPLYADRARAVLTAELGQAEAAGAVRVGPDSDTSEIFVGHPLYADRARAVLTAE